MTSRPLPVTRDPAASTHGLLEQEQACLLPYRQHDPAGPAELQQQQQIAVHPQLSDADEVHISAPVLRYPQAEGLSMPNNINTHSRSYLMGIAGTGPSIQQRLPPEQPTVVHDTNPSCNTEAMPARHTGLLERHATLAALGLPASQSNDALQVPGNPHAVGSEVLPAPVVPSIMQRRPQGSGATVAHPSPDLACIPAALSSPSFDALLRAVKQGQADNTVGTLLGQSHVSGTVDGAAAQPSTLLQLQASPPLMGIARDSHQPEQHSPQQLADMQQDQAAARPMFDATFPVEGGQGTAHVTAAAAATMEVGASMQDLQEQQLCLQLSGTQEPAPSAGAAAAEDQSSSRPGLQEQHDPSLCSSPQQISPKLQQTLNTKPPCAQQSLSFRSAAAAAAQQSQSSFLFHATTAGQNQPSGLCCTPVLPNQMRPDASAQG